MLKTQKSDRWEEFLNSENFSKVDQDFIASLCYKHEKYDLGAKIYSYTENRHLIAVNYMIEDIKKKYNETKKFNIEPLIDLLINSPIKDSPIYRECWLIVLRAAQNMTDMLTSKDWDQIIKHSTNKQLLSLDDVFPLIPRRMKLDDLNQSISDAVASSSQSISNAEETRLLIKVYVMDNPYLTYDVNGVTYQVVADIEKKQMRINREYIPEDDFMSCQAVIIPTKEYCTFATKTPEGISMFNAQYNCSATTKLKRFSMRDRNILSVVTPENNLLIASLDKKTKEISDSVSNLSSLSEENAATSEELSATSDTVATSVEGLREQQSSVDMSSKGLSEIVGRFKVDASFEDADTQE